MLLPFRYTEYSGFSLTAESTSGVPLFHSILKLDTRTSGDIIAIIMVKTVSQNFNIGQSF